MTITQNRMFLDCWVWAFCSEWEHSDRLVEFHTGNLLSQEHRWAWCSERGSWHRIEVCSLFHTGCCQQEVGHKSSGWWNLPSELFVGHRRMKSVYWVRSLLLHRHSKPIDFGSTRGHDLQSNKWRFPMDLIWVVQWSARRLNSFLAFGQFGWYFPAWSMHAHWTIAMRHYNWRNGSEANKCQECSWSRHIFDLHLCQDNQLFLSWKNV